MKLTSSGSPLLQGTTHHLCACLCVCVWLCVCVCVCVCVCIPVCFTLNRPSTLIWMKVMWSFTVYPKYCFAAFCFQAYPQTHTNPLDFMHFLSIWVKQTVGQWKKNKNKYMIMIVLRVSKITTCLDKISQMIQHALVSVKRLWNRNSMEGNFCA